MSTARALLTAAVVAVACVGDGDGAASGLGLGIGLGPGVAAAGLEGQGEWGVVTVRGEGDIPKDIFFTSDRGAEEEEGALAVQTVRDEVKEVAVEGAGSEVVL